LETFDHCFVNCRSSSVEITHNATDRQREQTDGLLSDRPTDRQTGSQLLTLSRVDAW